jgi:hypothetical protein
VTVRSGLLFGVLAALIAALPAALRADHGLVVWAALAGAAAVLLGPVLAALTQLRPLRTGLLAIALGLGLSAWPTALLLSVLKSSTHHRPLGAVTFAFAAAVLALGASAAALRLLTWFQRERPNGFERAARGVLTAFAVAGPLVLLLRLGASAQTRAPLFDASLALGLSALTQLVPWPARILRWAERVGLPVWAGVVVIGLLSAHAASERAFAASPVLLAPIAWLLR